jgi:hypothetical protein
MITFDRPVECGERVAWKSPNIVSLGRWVNPALGILGALALGGYLLSADPAIPVARAPDPLPVARVAPPAPVPALLALSSDTAIVSYSRSVPDEPTPTSTFDLLKPVFAAVLAWAWVMIGARLSVRNARALMPLDEPL